MYASRAGEKLDHALKEFNINVRDLICADLGCSTGGFTSCLLINGATKVYAVDTGYGVLDYQLRKDPRVIVRERSNAMFVTLPEKIDFISIDVGWTPQHLILPHALSLLKPGGIIVSLLKPHYESKIAHVSPEKAEEIANEVLQNLAMKNIHVEQMIKSPILGEKAANTEYLLLVTS